MFGPILRGQHINLEPPRHEDLDAYRLWFAIRGDALPAAPLRPISRRKEQEWYRRAASSDSDVIWAIVNDGQVIGTTGIHSINWMNRHAATGTVIGDRSRWGKGYGSEVVRLRTVFAFEELNLERLETESFAENVRMHRALQKVGYREMGAGTATSFEMATGMTN